MRRQRRRAGCHGTSVWVSAPYILDAAAAVCSGVAPLSTGCVDERDVWSSMDLTHRERKKDRERVYVCACVSVCV